MPNIGIREFSDLDNLTIASVEYIVGLHGPLNKQTYLLPGGQTPILFHKHLAKAINDWAGTNLLLSDERLVPEKNNMSNVGMVKKQFFDNINSENSPHIVVVVVKSKLTDPEQIHVSVNDYSKTLFPLTAAFLGIGSDGHTASLFPRFEELFFNSNLFFKVDRPSEPFSRISISANVITETPQIFFLVSGSEKQSVMRTILEIPNKKDILPVQKILRKAFRKQSQFRFLR